MYVSKFNYVTDYEKDKQKLLLNFLTRSTDIIDSESADYFLDANGEGKLTSEDKSYLLERGYAFSGKDQEFQILRKLYENELKNTAPIYIVHFATFGNEHLHFDKILKSINEMEGRRNEKSKAELFLYSGDSLNPSLNIHELEEFVGNCNSLNISTKLITTQKTFSFFQSLFTKGIVADITLISLLSELSDTSTFLDDTERFLDHLVEHGKKVTIDLRLNRKDVKKLKLLINYFIYKGWPFLENFECCLEPADNEACFFGYWYNTDIKLAKDIFKIFGSYPQTEFCSVEKWIGINNLYELIWKGRPPSPSFHFCNASRGLMVFTGDGNIFPCLKLAETARETFLKNKVKLDEFRKRNGMILSDCKGCRYILSCGGGCSYKAILQNNARVCCPPIKDLIEIALEGYFDELLEKSKFFEQIHGEIQP